MKRVTQFCFILSFIILAYAHVPQAHAVTLESTKSAELDVSARVKARQDDYLFTFTSSLTGNTVGADTEIEYIITYGSKLDYWSPFVIEAEWSLGTVPSQSLYSYNILSYVAGSATTDYWGWSIPVVDLVNRRIRWVVTRFPPNTIGKQLRFRLRTPGHYVTDQNVNFTVRARLVQEDLIKGWANLEQIYTPGEFIRREVRGMQILVAEVRRITDTSFTLFLVTSVPTKTVIYYGLTPDELDKTFTDDTLSEQKLVTIEGLKPATTYYYRILIENEKGIQRKTPEVFQVTTSATSLISLIDQDRVLISSRGVLLKNTSGLGRGTSIVVPQGVPVELYLPFKAEVPSTVLLSLANQSVLGISTDMPPATADQKVRLLETQFRTFTGTITAPVTRGQYDMVLETQGEGTGTNQDMMTSLIVSDPITILNEKGKPVEKAIVYLERWNDTTRAFEYFPAESFGSHNPGYSDSDGSVDFILPEGQYMVNVNAIGYKTYQQNFSFNPSGKTPYPRVSLVGAPFSLLTYVAYYRSVVLDSWRFFNYSVDKLASSWRFLDLSILTSLIILTVLSILANLRRVKLSLEGFLIFGEKQILRIFGRPKVYTMFIGFIEHGITELPVHAATVFLVNKKSRVIVGRDVTNSLGEFHLRIDPGNEYELVVKKHGFMTTRETVGAEELITGHAPFPLHPETVLKLPLWLEFPKVMAGAVFHAASDTLLFAVGILNLLLFTRLGVKVLPTFILTALNAFLWLEYEWHLFRAGKGK